MLRDGSGKVRQAAEESLKKPAAEQNSPAKIICPPLLTSPATTDTGPPTAYAYSPSREQINDLARELIDSYQARSAPTEMKKVAILPLDATNPGLHEQIGRAVSEMLIQSFSKSSLFHVIERDKLGSIFKELALNAAGTGFSRPAVDIVVI